MGKNKEYVERFFDHRGRLVKEITTTYGVMDSALGSLDTLETHVWMDPFIAGDVAHDDAPKPSARQRVVAAILNAVAPGELMPLVMDWLQETQE